MVSPQDLTRRYLVSRIAASLGAVLVAPFGHASVPKTGNATEGANYPKPWMRRTDSDNDLVKVEGVVAEAGGEIIVLKGVVTDRADSPLSGLRVEIWQCDLNGKYLHPGDRQKMTHDIAFQGFGHDITDEQGAYRFRTIKPGKYPGRTQHIHVKILRDGKDILTTQLYIDGEPNNQSDGIYRGLSADEARAVSMRFIQRQGQAETVVNLVV